LTLVGSLRRPGRLALVAFITATAVIAIPSVATAKPPNAAEPSLFVVRAPATYDNGVLTIRTNNLEWFTDRPNRNADSLTSKELVEHWGGWGFSHDPPNAAIISGKVDAIGELTKPKLQGDALRFRFDPFRGEPKNGNLGKISLLIDPTGTANYELQVINNSQNPTSMTLYQAPPDGNPNLLPLAWFSQFTYPQTTLTYTWDTSSQLMWSQTGQLVPGVIFKPAQIMQANPASAAQNSTTLTNQGALTFTAIGTGGPVPVGSLGITQDATVPPGQAAIAFGQSGAAVFATQAQPSFRTVITPRPQYWITAGNYQPGQVLDPDQVSSTSAQINFPPGVTSMVATLNIDGTWSVQPAS
jgi:rhizosphere induced protein